MTAVATLRKLNIEKRCDHTHLQCQCLEPEAATPLPVQVESGLQSKTPLNTPELGRLTEGKCVSND